MNATPYLTTRWHHTSTKQLESLGDWRGGAVGGGRAGGGVAGFFFVLFFSNGESFHKALSSPPEGEISVKHSQQ